MLEAGMFILSHEEVATCSLLLLTPVMGRRQRHLWSMKLVGLLKTYHAQTREAAQKK